MKMLSKSMWLACFWAVAKSQNQQQEMNCTVEDGEMPDSQFGHNNFVIDNLDSLLFPFAIGQCTSGHLYQTNTWFMYECSKDSNDMWTVIKTQHTDDICSSTGMIVDQFLESNVTEGMKGYFDCNGTNTYLEMEFSLNPDCQNQVTVYGALGSCVNFVNSSRESMQMNLFCDNDGAKFQIFSSMLNQTMTTIEPFNATLPSSISNQSQMCYADSFCDKWMVSEVCELLTELPFGNNQTQLYARWVGCLSISEAMSTTDLMMSTTELMSSTEATLLSTEIKSTAMSTANVIEEDSSAVRPSFLFASGLLFALSFLFSI